MAKKYIESEELGVIEVIDSPRAKNIRLSVSNGKIKITKPKYVPLGATKAFVKKNEQWAQKRLAQSKEKTLIHDGDIVAPRTKVRFVTTEANSTAIDLTDKEIVVQLQKESEFSDEESQQLLVAELKKLWRKEAKRYIPKRLEYLAELHGFTYKALRLKDIRTRWGSCSSMNNININIQLIKLNDELIDHVLLHELSHTKAMNHGDDFWRVFETVRPNARSERKQLKQMTII